MQFEHWHHSNATVTIVASLARKAEALREAELERLFARCPEMNQRERTLVTGLSRRIVSKLLHPAISSIRAGDAAQLADSIARAQMIEQIFALTHDDVAPESAEPGRRSEH
jgi:glutamyl-tRNA reductase